MNIFKIYINKVNYTALPVRAYSERVHFSQGYHGGYFLTDRRGNEDASFRLEPAGSVLLGAAYRDGDNIVVRLFNPYSDIAP